MIRKKLCVVACTIVFAAGCSKKKSSSDESSSASPDGGGSDTADTAGTDADGGDDVNNQPPAGTIAVANELVGVAYPGGLTVSALPQAVDPSPGVAAAGTTSLEGIGAAGTIAVGLTLTATETQHPKDKLADVAEVLSGEAGSCFDPQVFSRFASMMGPEIVCYLEDFGILSGSVEGKLDKGQVNPAAQTIAANARTAANVLAALKGATGFQASGNAEACMVAKSREFVDQLSAKLSAALDLVAGMLCEAKKADETALPAVGESLDFTAKLAAVDQSPSPTTVQSAKITRAADAGGRKVFTSVVKFTRPAPGGGAFIVRLTHSPYEDSAIEYSGSLQIVSETTVQPGNHAADGLLSMVYAKEGTSYASQRIKYEVREMSIRQDNGPHADPLDYFDADGRLDLNAFDPTGSMGPGADDFGGAATYYVVDINPSNYAGKVSAWRNFSGNYGEAARGFVLSTAQQSSGKIAGCAWAGAMAGTHIRKAINLEQTVTPDGCFTPMITHDVCGTPGDNVGPQVWKQCFIQNDDGVYEIDTTKVTDDAAGFDVLSSAPSDIPEIDGLAIDSVAP